MYHWTKTPEHHETHCWHRAGRRLRHSSCAKCGLKWRRMKNGNHRYQWYIEGDRLLQECSALDAECEHIKGYIDVACVL